jgi:hypothetical protein
MTTLMDVSNGIADINLPAMTGAEMAATREHLGLPLQWLAESMVINMRRLQRMESGAFAIPEAVIGLLDEISEETKHRVQDLVAQYRRQVKSSASTVLLRTYKGNQTFWDSSDALTVQGYSLPASWHRMLCQRVVQAVPGLVLTYTIDAETGEATYVPPPPHRASNTETRER